MTVYLLAGLGYGDEGKGSVTDWLVRHTNADLVVRYNGGAQAAHNVVLPDGKHHTFAQFGSGTFAGARTFLSRHMLFNPVSLMAEAKALEDLGVDPWPNLYISENALVTTPFHVAANRIREMARDLGRHGSCGMGIGETRKDFEEKNFGIRVKDLLRDVSGGSVQIDTGMQAIGAEGLWSLLARHQEMKRLEVYKLYEQHSKGRPAFETEWELFNPSRMAETLQFVGQQMTAFLEKIDPEKQIVSDDWLEKNRGEHVVFEGAQGMLLDQKYGFFPYVTRTDLTFNNAEDLLTDFQGPHGEVTYVGITRSYTTRHGAGPFVTEDPEFDEWSADDHNSNNPWQQGFRSGPLDIPALRYAKDCIGGLDALVITHMDKVQDLESIPVCVGYRPPNSMPSALPIRDIPRVREPTLAGQAELTSWLQTLDPVIGELPPDRLAPVLAEELNCDILALSYGQTHEDKAVPDDDND